MIPNFVSFLFAMLFASDIWAVYGIGLPSSSAIECENCEIASISGHALPTKSFETPVPALPSSTTPALITNPPVAPSVDLETHDSSTPFHELSVGARVGIVISVAATFVLLVSFLVFGIQRIRSRRRTRALQRAIEEVERGVEMQKVFGHETETMREPKDNLVLESRVEIVVDDGQSERNAVEAWDGWNAGWTEDDDLERGRKGMSLPRREY